MRNWSDLLAATGLMGLYIAYRNRQGKKGLDCLVPLSPRIASLVKEIRACDERAILEGRLSEINESGFRAVSVREMWTTMRNFRSLACEVDRKRVQCEEDREEFDMLHAIVARNVEDIHWKFAKAVLEVGLSKIPGGCSWHYARSFLSAYADQVYAVTNLLQLAGDNRSIRLEGHLPS